MSAAAPANEPLDTLLANLTGEHEPRTFWDALCSVAVQSTDAVAACFVTRTTPDTPWQILTTSDAEQFASPGILADFAEQTLSSGTPLLHEVDHQHFASGLLNQADSPRQIILVLRLPSAALPNGLPAALTVLKVAIAQNISERRLAKLKVEHDSFQQAFSIGEQLRAAQSANEGWLILCNALAEYLQADRVSLGLVNGTKIDIRAVSGKHNMSASTEWADMLISVMEEGYDQRVLLCINSTADEQHPIAAPAHQSYQKQFDAPHLLTLPVTLDATPEAVLVCERYQRAWQPAEELALQSLVQQLHSPIGALVARSANWLKRTRRSAEAKLFELTRVKNTGAKLGLAALFFAFILICVIEVPYRINGNFLIDAENQVLVAAQRDGTLNQINVTEGQSVVAGDVLAQLENIDLRLRQAELLADLARAQAQQEGAMSMGAYAELRVAEAEVARVNAELQWVDINLQAGRLVAPSGGLIMTDEELSRRLGSPITKGDVLLSIAQPQSWKVVIEVEEAEINHLQVNAEGEITFVSRPTVTLPITVERIETKARTRATGTVFRVFSTINASDDIWWKPGMTGIAKVNAGDRTLIWIWTHRFVDWLRLALWF